MRSDLFIRDVLCSFSHHPQICCLLTRSLGSRLSGVLSLGSFLFSVVVLAGKVAKKRRTETMSHTPLLGFHDSRHKLKYFL